MGLDIRILLICYVDYHQSGLYVKPLLVLRAPLTNL
jgi:hypothetical protein